MRLRERILLVVCYFYTTCSGLLPVRFDRQQKRLRPSPVLGVICYALNALLLLFLAAIVYLKVAPAADEHDHNIIIGIVMFLSAAAHILAVVLTILRRRTREQQTLAIVAALRCIERQHFSAATAKEEWRTQKFAEDIRRLDRLVYNKIALMLCQTAALLAGRLLWLYPANWLDVVRLVVMFAIANLLNGARFHLCLALAHISKRFEQLNARLEHFCAAGDYDLLELQSLFVAHAKLRRLVVPVGETFKYEVFLNMSTYFINIVMTGFAWFACISRLPHDWNYVVEMSASIGVVAFFTGDMYLFDRLVEASTTCCRDTMQILRRYAAVPTAPATVERSCEWFALQLTWQHVRFRVLDIFVVNRQQTFAVVSNMILYIIFLVQSDYHRIWS